jgi:hypothetical protein
MSVHNKAVAILDMCEGLDPADTYRTLIDSIDWNRVLLEAQSRHLTLDHSGDYTCGVCIAAALLVKETWPDWLATRA